MLFHHKAGIGFVSHSPSFLLCIYKGTNNPITTVFQKILITSIECHTYCTTVTYGVLKKYLEIISIRICITVSTFERKWRMKFNTEQLLCECRFKRWAIWPYISGSYCSFLFYSYMRLEYYFCFVMFTVIYSFMNIALMSVFKEFIMCGAYRAYFLFYTPIIDDKLPHFFNQHLHGLLLHLLFSNPLFMHGNVSFWDRLTVPFLKVISRGMSFLGLNFLSLSKWHL